MPDCFGIPVNKSKILGLVISLQNQDQEEIQRVRKKNFFFKVKGSRTGHFVKVSLWYASLLTITRFRFFLILE